MAANQGDAVAAKETEPPVVLDPTMGAEARPDVTQVSDAGAAASKQLLVEADVRPERTAPQFKGLESYSKKLAGPTQELDITGLRPAEKKIPAEHGKLAESQPLEAVPRRSHVGRAQIASLREDAASEDKTVASLAQRALFDLATDRKLASKKYQA